MIMILGDMILSLTWLNLTTQRGLVLVSLLVTSFIVLSFLLSSSFISIPYVLSSFQCYQWTFYHSIDLFYCSVLLLCFVVLLFCCSVVLSCYCSVVPSFYHSTVLSCHHPRIHSLFSIRHLSSPSQFALNFAIPATGRIQAINASLQFWIARSVEYLRVPLDGIDEWTCIKWWIGSRVPWSTTKMIGIGDWFRSLRRYYGNNFKRFRL